MVRIFCFGIQVEFLIYYQPNKVLVSEGQPAKLVVDAISSKAITYQWSKAGKDIEGARR